MAATNSTSNISLQPHWQESGTQGKAKIERRNRRFLQPTVKICFAKGSSMPTG
jgi:hypothetical protein